MTDMTETAEAQARFLSAALPYMQRYENKTIVVKYGGHAMGDADRVPGRPVRFGGRSVAMQPPDLGFQGEPEVAKRAGGSLAVPACDDRLFPEGFKTHCGAQLVERQPADEILGLIRADIAIIRGLACFRDQEIEQDLALRGKQRRGLCFAGLDRVDVRGDQVLQEMLGVGAVHSYDGPVGKDQGWHGAALRIVRQDDLQDWWIGRRSRGQRQGRKDQSPAMKKRHSPSGEMPTR